MNSESTRKSTHLDAPSRSASRLFAILVVFAVLGFIADVLYPIASGMGAVTLVISPGELLRGLQILFLCMLLLSRHIRLISADLAFALLFLFLGIIFYSMTGADPSYEVAQRLFWAVKLFYLILMIGLVRTLIEHNEAYAHRTVELLIWLSVVFLVVPTYLSAFNILGYESYGTATYRSGFKGFMYAQNSMSIAIIAILPLVFVYAKSSLLKYFVLGASLLVGTKAAAAAGIGTLVFAIFVGLHLSHGRARWTVIKPVVLAIALGYFTFWIYAPVLRTNLTHYVSTYQSTGDFMLTLTTGRWQYLYLFPAMLKRLDLLEIVLGTTVPTFNEIDVTAIFTRFGLTAVLWYGMFIGRQITCSLTNIFADGRRAAIAFSAVLICTHSLLGGHVIGNAVVAYSVATVFALNQYFARHRPDQEAPIV